MNFWNSLPRPFLALAPMEDVTDTVFRRVIKRCAAPDVFFTEFTNVEGILSPGVKHVAQRLQYTEEERPLVAQIWGQKPENFFKVAKLLGQMGFDGIDINMGCPARDLVKKGCCSALIDNHSAAKEIILATVEGAGRLPVSVKTRCGVREWKTEEWVSFLLGLPIAALTIHGRIASEMSNFPARWDEIEKAVNVRNEMNSKIPIIGNGDVNSYLDAKEKVEKFGVDGVMIGRGVFKNPWVFERNSREYSLDESLGMLVEHARLFDRVWGKNKNFAILKKFFKAYIHGFDGAGEIRSRLMAANSLAEVEDIVAGQILTDKSV